MKRLEKDRTRYYETTEDSAQIREERTLLREVARNRLHRLAPNPTFATSVDSNPYASRLFGGHTKNHAPKIIKTSYSYVRFSTPEQEMGDSERCQIALATPCAKTGCALRGCLC